MKIIRKFIIKYGHSIAAIALAVNVLALNPTCRFFFHQPKIPNELICKKRNTEEN